ncbi:outer membrane protein with beta-barrel domain [Pedobacter psychrotolerans]|uniref:Outer membrane protein with beta-barrel domain n=1 Tax=Pedobacter psychrotolerans TaxID=1843235 RepID=A0A4R2H4Y9_9SPHI|nr:outer membrane beta-barrel protein [Pedobacter psychrotolerans]TCO20774.1 outer membrane protein with beta-barrel domain [Pedobacter psychrotolerans]GGE68004.1 hypothetical protein GCM10011413_38320 [Pedobacter psychrotolerans]
MDKELIEHITTQLQNHEENYAPGAWERFSKKEEKKRGGFVFWPLWTAAAIILVLSGLFLFNYEDKTNKNTIAKSKTENTDSQLIEPKKDHIIDHQIAVEDSKTALKNDEKSAVPQAKNTYQAQVNDFESQNPLFAIKQVQDKTNERKIDVLENIANVTPANSGLANTEVKVLQEKPKANNKMTFEDLLALDSKTNHGKNAQNKVNHSQKWEQDVYVAPSMGNDSKVNMNYGFSLSYAIANKLSISSGVSYASISSTESQNAAAPQSLSGKNLESINAKVQGINVPLEVRYNISDKLYTGIGVSALAVLNNSQQNTYLVNQVQTLSSPLANGTTDSKSFIVAEKQSEPQPTSTIDPDKYIGFYNFSLGYKQKISKKNNIAIEPFLRLPMKTFSRENLNLTNGGLRLKVDF